MNAMKRLAPALVVVAMLPACARSELAYVHVEDPRAVSLERTTEDGPRTLIPAGGAVMARADDAPIVDDVARRTPDGAIEIERDAPKRLPLQVVDAAGELAPVRPGSIPMTSAETMWIALDRREYPGLAVATPWANVDRVTVRQQTVAPLAWLELGIGLALLGGGSALAMRGGEDDSRDGRDLQVGSGVTLAVLGAVVTAFGAWALGEPSSEVTWAPQR